MTVKFLLDCGVVKDYQHTKKSWTPLHIAIENDHILVVKELVDHGVNIESTLENGYTPLILAASKGHVHIVDLLLASGAKIDAQSNTNSTALHYASENGHAEVVSLLCDYNASKIIEDKVSE